MRSIKLHFTYGLIILILVVHDIFQAHFQTQANSIVSLHDLAVQLQQNGANLRAVPQRPDGLLLDAIYLTQTQQDASTLGRLYIDPNHPEKWTGTVIVLQEGLRTGHYYSSDWGEHGWIWGPFLFFGDGEILAEIRRALPR